MDYQHVANLVWNHGEYGTPQTYVTDCKPEQWIGCPNSVLPTDYSLEDHFVYMGLLIIIIFIRIITTINNNNVQQEQQ